LADGDHIFARRETLKMGVADLLTLYGINALKPQWGSG
jgi:hypothetical protein